MPRAPALALALALALGWLHADDQRVSQVHSPSHPHILTSSLPYSLTHSLTPSLPSHSLPPPPTQVSVETVQAAEAYILFYERRQSPEHASHRERTMAALRGSPSAMRPPPEGGEETMLRYS